MPEKVNLVKADKTYYSASTKPEIVEFGPLSYLSLTGQGEPAGEAFTRKVEALYPLAYGVKRVYKSGGRDFAVPKLEGLWWVGEDRPALEVPRSQWMWKLLIRMPDFVAEDVVTDVKADVGRKKKNELINLVRFESITEGKCVQALHIGPYATEPLTIEMLLRFIEENGLTINGLHHEIYLSDPRKTQPDKMKTIIRYPVR